MNFCILKVYGYITDTFFVFCFLRLIEEIKMAMVGHVNRRMDDRRMEEVHEWYPRKCKKV